MEVLNYISGAEVRRVISVFTVVNMHESAQLGGGGGYVVFGEEIHMGYS